MISDPPAFLRGIALPQKKADSSGQSAGFASPTSIPGGTFAKLAELYRRMEESYNNCAAEAGLSCANCPTNCCTSYFQHHTYVEWIYLWKGLNVLPPSQRTLCIRRAEWNVKETRRALAVNALPSVMCPLNESGLCALYAHRLMICRLHGTRNAMTLPDGSQRFFPGCEQFTALPFSSHSHPPTLDRTLFYKELAGLEMELYHRSHIPLPKVNLTLAEMIVAGPPRLE